MEEKGYCSDYKEGRGRGSFKLNYLVGRQISKPKGKLVSFFVDLKAEFDSVDREVLVEILRERGVREGLVERIEEVLRETKSRVKVGKLSEEFWLGREA